MMMLVGEAWGVEEAHARTAFVGASGRFLRNTLAKIGISHFYLTNVFNHHPPSNDVSFFFEGGEVRKEFVHHLDRLRADIEKVRPNIIVALGLTAFWALTGRRVNTKWRGTILPSRFGPKTLLTFHPAYVLRVWEDRLYFFSDLHRAARESGFPEIRRTNRRIHIPTTTGDLLDFEREYLNKPTILACDIETAEGLITEVGISPDPTVALVVPFLSRSRGNYWSNPDDELFAWEWLRRILTTHIVGGHNFLYDVNFLYRQLGIRVVPRWDTMLGHHAAQPELEKSLAILASLYTNEPFWKSMRSAKKES